MANNPFPIDIDEADYFNRPAKEQRWITYCALRSIHTKGCLWARSRWRRIVFLVIIISTITGLLGGFLSENGIAVKCLAHIVGM